MLRKKNSEAVAIAQPAAVTSANSVIAASLKIPGLRYAEINLNGKGFERALLWRLSWSNLAKLISLMALGRRNEAISILGKEVMQPRGLIGLGIDTLDNSCKEIREVFEVLSDHQAYPILVHCTQGKDRTGLIILLVLLLCEVDIRDISEDYMRSESELEPEKTERLEEIASIGLNETFAGCLPDFAEKIVQHINEHYGGIQKYLINIGLGISLQDKIKAFICHRE